MDILNVRILSPMFCPKAHLFVCLCFFEAVDFRSLFILHQKLAAHAQMVACLPLVKRVRGSIPGEIVNFQPRG